jgi:hypothetical protein
MSFYNTDCLRSRLFQGPEWLGYPHDGYNTVSLREYLNMRPKKETLIISPAASYQSMLTFGLVEAVIEAPVAEDMLVQKDQSGKRVMTTSRLIDIIRSWLSRIEVTQPKLLASWFERVRGNLRIAHSLMLSFATKDFEPFKPLGDEAPSMVCFIAIIAEALVNAHARMVVGSRMPNEGFSWSMIWTPPIREALRGKLHADGWCPSTIEYLASTASVSSLRYAYNQGPLNDCKNHSGCTPQSCTAYDVDIKTYVPKHNSECKSVMGVPETQCEYHKPALQQVISCIESDHIPVVTLNSFTLEIHKSTDMPYVALSHVWADGLGSTSEDGLPICQLQRLSALVSSLHPGAAFWVDSICIPKAKLARKKAIGMMARTYQDAEAVLVLDSGLQLISSSESPGMKLLAVLTSGWMRRLWTLQEGVLAKQLYIQFADTHKALIDLIPQTADMLLQPYQTDLAAELFRLMKRSGYGSYTIGDVARSLRWRDTSRATDETLAIASLLGIPVSPFLDLSGEERMLLLFKEVHKFPKNILFLRGSKLDIPGSRWVPASLMAARNGNGGGLEISSQGTDAMYTSKGLQATYYALSFRERTIETGKPWMIRDKKSNRLYKVIDLPSAGEKSYQCSLVLTMTAIPHGSASACVAALGNKRPAGPSADGSFIALCEYKRRLLLIAVTERDSSVKATADVVDATASGMLQVCIG